MKQFSKHFYVLLASLLLIFAFYLPVHAEGETEPRIIPLAQGQTLNGSFPDNGSTKVYYAITITEKQAITVYGTQPKGKYVSLSIYDQDMKYVDHQSLVSTTASSYSWRTDILEPGNYYICASCNYAISYTITYDPSPFPNSIPLAQGQVQSGSFSGDGYTYDYYYITITQKQAITIYGTQPKRNDISLSLHDQAGKYLSSNSTETRDTNYRFRTETLDPGNYYLIIGSSDTITNYTIAYDPRLYPNAVPLARKQKISSKIASSYDIDSYQIVLTEPLSITFSGTKNKNTDLSFSLLNEDGDSISRMYTDEDDGTNFSCSPDQKLSKGTYYLLVSGDEDNVTYSISWQVKGPAAVGNLRASKKTTNAITLKWKKSSGASKYIVYTYNTKKKTYQKYKTVTSATCKVTKLKTATKYKFKVVPVMKYGSEEIQGDAEIIQTATAPKKVNTPTVTYRSAGSLSGVPVNYYKMKWKKVKGASGYEVYVKAQGTNGWKKSGTTKSTSTLLYVVKGYSAQVKVRAYISNSGNYSYGAFSNAKTINSR